MRDVHQAAKDLREFLGRPPWLSAIGIGSQDDRPAIVLYLVYPPKPKPRFLDEGWEGFPVLTREFGSFAPLGSS